MTQRTVRIAAVGDLQLGDSPIRVGFGFRTRVTAETLSATIAGVRASVADADILFGNLETPLSDYGLSVDQWSSRQLRGRPSYVEALRAFGFTVLNVANNHAVQHGVEAFEESRRRLAEAGIAACGVRGSAPWASEPVVLPTSAGLRVGILAYCLRPRQYGSEVPPYAEGDRDSIRRDVERLRVEVDHVVVSLHWGEEFVVEPSAREVELGRAVVEAGATMIIGHHPHVVRPVERHGQAIIAYSLGNLLGDMNWHPPFRRGAILRGVLSPGGVADAEVLLTHLDDEFRVTVTGPGPAPVLGITGLTADEYAAAIRRTQRAQRVASYRYALRHLGEYPRPMLGQLLTRTLRNKLAAAMGRAG